MKSSTNPDFDYKKFILENSPKMQQLKVRMSQSIDEENRLNKEEISLKESHKSLVDKKTKAAQTSSVLKANLTQNSQKLDTLDNELEKMKLRVSEQDYLKDTMKLFLGDFNEYKNNVSPVGNTQNINYDDIIDSNLNQDL